MFALEHSRMAYWADFAAYVAAIGCMCCAVLFLAPASGRAVALSVAASGLIAWSLVEYLIHRFVLHGLNPFKTWHARHHERPTALISAPTILSGTLIVALIFIPTLLVSSTVTALSLTLGITTGYLAYAVCHHATHHWRTEATWLKERKVWHALHHRHASGICYGVTSTVWDRAFGSAPAPTQRAVRRLNPILPAEPGDPGQPFEGTGPQSNE
jgi:sterol desaturase/sphingolipid hydroxylase (fatty acid hydroxylase superfamily)